MKPRQAVKAVQVRYVPMPGEKCSRCDLCKQPINHMFDSPDCIYPLYLCDNCWQAMQKAYQERIKGATE